MGIEICTFLKIKKRKQLDEIFDKKLGSGLRKKAGYASTTVDDGRLIYAIKKDSFYFTHA